MQFKYLDCINKWILNKIYLGNFAAFIYYFIGNYMTTLNTVSINHSDVIDTRDIQELIEQLQDEIDNLEDEIDNFDESENEAEYAEMTERLENMESDMAILENIRDEVGSEFEHGEPLIAENYFTDYQREMLIDCGYLNKELPWFIESNIDWEGVADDMKQDYSTIEIEGNTYYFRYY